MAPAPRLSVIIPVLNEAAIVGSALQAFPWSVDTEVLMVDGGSEDETVALCQQYPVKLLSSSQTGRAWQLNQGAAQARGDILLFLHLDSRLPLDHVQQIEQTLAQPGVVAGAFQFRVALPGWSYRGLETLVNWRSHRWQLPYGDQGLFIKRQKFWQLGGFAALPLLEDYEWVRRLHHHGSVAIAPSPVLCSGRRWQQLGLVRTTCINQVILLAYHCGIAPTTLAHWYYQR